MPRLARLLFGALALIAAPLLLAQGMANARMEPALIGLNGFWKADVGSALVQVQQLETSLELDVSESGLDLAHQAFEAEPLASEALFPIAISWQSEGRLDDANALVDTGLRLDKRSRPLGVLALQREAMAQNLPGIFEQIDRLAVLNPQLISDFIQPLTAAMDDPEAVPVIRDALAGEPEWAEAFWKSVPTTPAGAGAMYSLRQQTDIGVTEDSDERLLSGLARAGLYAEALAHWDARFAEAGASETVFLETDDFAPIGWQSERSGDISFSRSGSGAFDIYVGNQNSGELARQLVRLSPGAYRFSADIRPASAAEDISVSLVCADRAGPAGPAPSLATPVTLNAVEGCEVYWLVLSGDAFERRGALEARLSAMQFGAAD